MISTCNIHIQSQCGARAISGVQVGGQLASWDAQPWLHELSQIPTLVIRGTAGEMSAGSTRTLVQGLGSGAQLMECEGAGSYVHIDAAQPVLDRLDAHMTVVDALSVGA